MQQVVMQVLLSLIKDLQLHTQWHGSVVPLAMFAGLGLFARTDCPAMSFVFAY